MLRLMMFTEGLIEVEEGGLLLKGESFLLSSFVVSLIF